MTDMPSRIAAAGKTVTPPARASAPVAGGMPLSQSLPVQSQGIDKAALRDAAEAFEAHFLRQMIGSMRSASLGEDLLGSNAGDQFRDLADDRIAESMAEQQSFGIAELLLQQFGVDDTRDTPFGEQK